MIRNYKKGAMPKILALSIAAIGMPASAFAQLSEDAQRLMKPESSIEVGVGHVSDDSFKFGDYTGLDEQGGYLIGNINYISRGGADGNANWVELIGRNLGLDSRSIIIRGGEQGNFGLRLLYDETPKLWSDSYQTPYTNPGSANLTLPVGWVDGAGTTGMTQLNASMRNFNVKTDREVFALGANKFLVGGWELVADFKRDKKQGNKLVGATFGTGGGNPRSAHLVQPTEYETDDLSLLARYTDDKAQMQLSYFMSDFNNANKGLMWENAYTGAYSPIGQYGLPPDNRVHKFQAQGGYNFSSHTRLAGSVSFGRVTQNDTFLPYNVWPGSTITTPLPRNSLDGEVNNTHVDLKLTNAVTPDVHFAAFYRYDDRDNKTPQSQYVYTNNDSVFAQATAGATATTRTNLPGSSTKQQVGADVVYKLAPETRLKFAYEYDWVSKNFEAITKEKEHTLKFGADHQFSDTFLGALSYAWSDRTTDAYNAAAPFYASYTGAAYMLGQETGGATSCCVWDNVPSQYKFFLAPRQRDKLRASANLMPNDNLDLQFVLDYKNDKYRDSELGLREAKGWAASFDANMKMSETFSSHVFYTHEVYETEQRSVQLGGNRALWNNPGWYWGYDIEDTSNTLGLGVKFKPTSNLNIDADISHIRSNGSVVTWRGPLHVAVFNGQFPDLTTELNRFDLAGKYQVQKDLAVNMSYAYEKYSSADWAYDNVTASTLANVIGTNEVSPKYDVHLIGVSLVYSFK